MKAVEIKAGIFWVGAIDWAVRDFHGYVTPRGTTYNNYLLMDEEITLVDTVKYDFSEMTIKNILSLVDPQRIRHVVINHIENDHATSLDKIMEFGKSKRITGTPTIFFRDGERVPGAIPIADFEKKLASAKPAAKVSSR